MALKISTAKNQIQRMSGSCSLGTRNVVDSKSISILVYIYLYLIFVYLLSIDNFTRYR